MLINLLNANFESMTLKRSADQGRSKRLSKHLIALSSFGLSDLDAIVCLTGYCPGRPPKQGVIALTPNSFVFCHKARLGASVTQTKLSHIYGFTFSKLINQYLIKIHSPSMVFEFATRMPEKEVQSFVSLLSLKLENNSDQ